MKLTRGACDRWALLPGPEWRTLTPHVSCAEAALTPAQPLSDKALELERRASALKELEGEELRKAAELNVLGRAPAVPAQQTHAAGSQR